MALSPRRRADPIWSVKGACGATGPTSSSSVADADQSLNA